MILWISLAAIFVFFLFLVTRWVGVRLVGSEDGLVVSASFARLRFTLHSGVSGEETKEKEEPKREKVKRDKGKTKDQIKNAIGWLRLASDFSNLVKSGLNFLGKYGRIAKLELRGSVGTGDPYLTGTFFGLIETFKGILGRVLPAARIDVQPEFGEERLDLEGTLGVEIRLIYAVFLIIFALWNLPKRKIWRLSRSS